MLKGLYGKLIKKWDPWNKSKRLADRRALNNFLKEISSGRSLPERLTGDPLAGKQR